MNRIHLHFLQLIPNGLQLFQVVLMQVDIIDSTYRPSHIKEDMIAFLELNKEYFEMCKNFTLHSLTYGWTIDVWRNAY